MKNHRISWLSSFSSLVVLANSFFAFAPLASSKELRESTVDVPRVDKKIIPSLSAFQPFACQFEKEYDDIWLLVQRYFLYRGRLKDWAKWRHKYDGHIETVDEFERSVDEMLASLHDPYTFYRNTQATVERETQDRETHVVVSYMLDHSVGYVKLKTFCSAHCVVEMRTALQQLQSAKALVLDLRDNRGGSIDDALSIFSMFVPSARFVSMKGVDDCRPISERLLVTGSELVDQRGNHVETRNREMNICESKPLLVLVDGRTKSAAEMLAGALRDNSRAILVGTRTYGKGVVQRVWEFNNHTSVKITSAAFFLPAGATINGVGIKPAITVLPSGKNDRQLQFARSMIKAKSRPLVAAKRNISKSRV